MVRRTLLLVPAFALVVGLSAARADDEHPALKLIKSKVKDPTKPFALVVTFKAKPGKEKELEATFAPCLAATKKEPGCIAYELNHDEEHPDTYFMYEKFKNLEAVATHLKHKHTQTLLAAVPALTEGELQIKVYAAAGE